jgi:hypothetical protein
MEAASSRSTSRSTVTPHSSSERTHSARFGRSSKPTTSASSLRVPQMGCLTPDQGTTPKHMEQGSVLAAQLVRGLPLLPTQVEVPDVLLGYHERYHLRVGERVA